MKTALNFLALNFLSRNSVLVALLQSSSISFFFSSIFMLICLSYFPLRSETQVDTRCLSRFNHTSIMCVWLECLVRGYLKYSIL